MFNLELTEEEIRILFQVLWMYRCDLKISIESGFVEDTHLATLTSLLNKTQNTLNLEIMNQVLNNPAEIRKPPINLE